MVDFDLEGVDLAMESIIRHSAIPLRSEHFPNTPSLSWGEAPQQGCGIVCQEVEGSVTVTNFSGPVAVSASFMGVGDYLSENHNINFVGDKASVGITVNSLSGRLNFESVGKNAFVFAVSSQDSAENIVEQASRDLGTRLGVSLPPLLSGGSLSFPSDGASLSFTIEAILSECIFTTTIQDYLDE